MADLTQVGSGMSRKVFTDPDKPGSVFKLSKAVSRNSMSNRQEFWVWKYGGKACPQLKPYLPKIISYEVVEDKLEMKQYTIPATEKERKQISGKIYRDLNKHIPNLKQKHVHQNNIALDGNQPVLIDLADLYKLLNK